MPVPQHEDKHSEGELVTPQASVAYFYDDPPPAPDAVALCYHDDPFDAVAESHPTSTFEAFGAAYALDETDGTVGVVRVPGVGAPAAALAMEGLIARGTRTVVSVGHVGGLQPAARVGDVVVADRALRDEGTSHHYLEPARFVEADGAVVEAIAARLDTAEAPYAVGPTWTTDAPHRETVAEVERYRAEGVLTVDMEAAAVFAVAEYRDIAAGAVFTISDLLGPDEWQPAFDETATALEQILESTLEALESIPG